MPIQVAKTISVHSRKTLIRNRDDIQARHGIRINFPMHLVRGDTQEMILSGGPNAIARAEREIDSILVSWHDEYTAFKRREANRKQNRRRNEHHMDQPHFPTIAESVSSNNTTNTPFSKNKFAALEVVETTEPTPTSLPQKPTPKPTPKQPTLKGWAAMASKPAAKPKTPPKPKMPTKFTFGTVGSGAAFTYVEPEQFDWAEEADTHFSPVDDDGWDTW